MTTALPAPSAPPPPGTPLKHPFKSFRRPFSVYVYAQQDFLCCFDYTVRIAGIWQGLQLAHVCLTQAISTKNTAMQQVSSSALHAPWFQHLTRWIYMSDSGYIV